MKIEGKCCKICPGNIIHIQFIVPLSLLFYLPQVNVRYFTYVVFLYDCFPYLTESKSGNNKTVCSMGQDNNSLLVYKVESLSTGHEEDTVRKIAIERQGATEVEVQVWKTVDGKTYEHSPLLTAQSS